jgi:hypothetical protein
MNKFIDQLTTDYDDRDGPAQRRSLGGTRRLGFE